MTKLIFFRLLCSVVIIGIVYFFNGPIYFLPLAFGLLIDVVLQLSIKEERLRQFWERRVTVLTVVLLLGWLIYSMRDHDFSMTGQFLIKNWTVSLVVIYLPVFLLVFGIYTYLSKRNKS
jgi:hypothetical protein